MLGIKSVAKVLAAIADLITRTKGLDDVHDDVGTVDTVVDSIVADYLAHAGYGLNAIVDLINAMAPILDTLDTRTATIVTDYLAHADYGLNAILDNILLDRITLGTLDTRTAAIVTDYLAHGTWGLNAIIDSLNTANGIIGDLRSNLCRWGQITAIDGNSFVSPELAGLGIDAMPAGWYIYVMQADDAAPEGEYRLLTDYADNGDIDHEAFSVALEVGDRVMLLHPSLAAIGERADTAAAGAVTTTDTMMAYVKQLVTELQVVDVVADSIIADYLAHADYGLNAIVDLLNAMAPILNTLDTRTATIVTDYLAHADYGLNAILDNILLDRITLGTLDTRTASIVTGYLAHGTWGLNAIVDLLNAANAIIPDLRSNLCRWGQIDSIDGNSFVSADLAGLGIDAMPAGWYVYVMQADNGAPEGEYRLLTDYANDGDIDHEAFSVALEVGDRVQLLHPVLGMLGQVDTAAAEGAVTNTDFMMAYVKQLVTELIVVDGIVDDIKALVDTAETDSSYTYTDGGGEQDVYTDAVTTRRKISFAMDINAMTQGGVVKVYLKVDGTNYRVWVLENVDSIASGGTEDVYTIEVVTNQNFKVSYTEDVDEGAARAIPYSVVTQVME